MSQASTAVLCCPQCTSRFRVRTDDGRAKSGCCPRCDVALEPMLPLVTGPDGAVSVAPEPTTEVVRATSMPGLAAASSASRPPGPVETVDGREESAASVASADPSRQLGRYAIAGRLGFGGMGDVLEIEDHEIGRTLAAKVIHGEIDLDRLEKLCYEGRVTGQLEHPGIPPVHELGRTADGQPYFTMKRVEGRDLAALLDLERRTRDAAARDPRHATQRAHGATLNRRPRSRATGDVEGAGQLRPLVEWLAIYLKAADAVRFAHSKGVIHRDLKPANIMVGEFGEVLVMDWGLAFPFGDAGGAHATLRPPPTSPFGPLTREGAIVGTPAYMPPEQALGQLARLGPASDVYSLGAVLYEILTLDRPFEGPNVVVLLGQVVKGSLVPPSERAPARDIPWELEAVVLRAMAAEPSDRYPTVRALQADVEAFLIGRRVGAAQYGVRAAARTWAGQHAVALRGVVAVLATIAVALCYALYDGARARGARVQAIRAANAAVDSAMPGAILERAIALAQAVEGRPGEPSQRRPPTPAEQATYAASLAELREVAGRYAELLQQVPSDVHARAGMHAVLATIGRLAAVADEHVLAEHALVQAVALGVASDEARSMLEAVRRLRAVRADHHRRRTRELLDGVRMGQITTPAGIDGARVEIASFRERPTVVQLMQALEPTIPRLRAAAREAMLGTGVPTATETRAGAWEELVGLAPAVEAWMARMEAIPASGRVPPFSDEHAKLIDGAFARLARRGAGGLEDRRHGFELLGTAQARAMEDLGRGYEAWAKLICDALGYLDDGDGPVELLARYAWADFAQGRAIPAGLALVRLPPASMRARALLDDTVGLGRAGRTIGKYRTSDRWWGEISGLRQDLLPLDSRGKPEDFLRAFAPR